MHSFSFSFSSFSLRATVVACGLFLVLGALGCSSAEDAATDALDEVHTSASYTGTWRAADGSEGPATATFEQRGLNGTATLTLTGHRCVSRAVISASVNRDGFAGDADVGAMHLRWSSKADLSELLGDFEALTNGPCPGEKGNVHLAR